MHQERLGAMEGLVVLLYHRLQGGVRRVDYMLLLVAFYSTKSFFRKSTAAAAASEGNNRLSQLAGLICAECMGLWRVLEDNNDNTNVQWLDSHPLMVGILPGNQNSSEPSSVSEQRAEMELEALSALVLKCIEAVKENDSPESLALLSFGLLLHLTYHSILSSSLGIDQTGYWQVRCNDMFEVVGLFSCCSFRETDSRLINCVYVATILFLYYFRCLGRKAGK